MYQDPLTAYKNMHTESLTSEFYDRQTLIEFNGPFKCTKDQNSFTYVIDGYVNASYNCIDRHPSDDIAIVWEADDININKQENEMTYGQLLQQVCQLANSLTSLGIVKGDRVAICTGQTPYSIIAMLACARIGAVHVVIFAGFSSDAIKDRLLDSRAKLVICSDVGKRGGKTIPIFDIMSKAMTDHVEHVIIAIRPMSIKQMLSNDKVYLDKAKESCKVTDKCLFYHDITMTQRFYCPPTQCHAEDPLFMLHTSGSTGKPKGLIHTVGGYLIGSALSIKTIFNLQKQQVFGCMADTGWITGHTYICYGPLLIGATTVLFEPTPIYPSPSRYIDTVIKWNINAFYTAPTAIRLLNKLKNQVGQIPQTSSCQILGSVGEPINPEAYNYYKHEFGSNAYIVDTYWQTETGSIVSSSIPYTTIEKPGSCLLPFLGINFALLDPVDFKVIENEGEGLLAITEPWPSMARTIWNDHQRYLQYFKHGVYLTGDTAARDKDGHYFIKGRMDDVINVAGHRLSTVEVESALAEHPDCSESAAIGINDEMSGQAIMVFVVPKYQSLINDKDFHLALRNQVRKSIGPIATPKYIVCVQDLPKTRSGKLMRRLLRQIVDKWMGMDINYGDTSTLADQNVLTMIETTLKEVKQ